VQRGRPCSFTIVHAPWPDCLFWIYKFSHTDKVCRPCNASPRMYTARWHRLQTHLAALTMLSLGHGQENRYCRTSCHPFLPSFHSSAADHLPANRMVSISNYPRLCLFSACYTDIQSLRHPYTFSASTEPRTFFSSLGHLMFSSWPAPSATIPARPAECICPNRKSPHPKSSG